MALAETARPDIHANIENNISTNTATAPIQQDTSTSTSTNANANANANASMIADTSPRPQPAVLNAWAPVDAAAAGRDTSTVALAQQRRQPSGTVASAATALNLPPMAIPASVLSNLPPPQRSGVVASTATTVSQAWQERSQQPTRTTPAALTPPGEAPAVAVPAAAGQTSAQQDNANPSGQQQRDPRERTPDGLINPDTLLRSTVPEPLPAAPLPDAAASAALASTTATPITADTPAPSISPSPSNDGQARSLGQALNDAFEALDTQVAYWSANNIQRASLNLQDGQAQALRIEVTLRDGQAQLDFHTDDSATREALRQNAETALRPLLESHGLELASWSIGAQTAGQGNTPERPPSQQPPATQAQQDGTRQRTGGSGPGDDAPAPRPAPRTPARPGGIDLYA